MSHGRDVNSGVEFVFAEGDADLCADAVGEALFAFVALEDEADAALQVVGAAVFGGVGDGDAVAADGAVDANAAEGFAVTAYPGWKGDFQGIGGGFEACGEEC